jgi:LacI family transcriptional regulator
VSKAKRKVLVVLGWHDVRTLMTLARYARNAGWHLETRHFFNESLPYGWEGHGMIITIPTRRDALRFVRHQAGRQPTVQLDMNDTGLRVAQVSDDNFTIGRLAAEHLLEMGHKHFAWWNAYEGRVPEERWRGFRESVSLAGYAAERLEYRARGTEKDWSRRRAWLLRRLRALPRPVALFALDDQLAAEAVEICLESALRVPQDVAVVGVGNIELACENSPVPISSVDNAPEETALAGARLLDRLMDGGRLPKEPIIIPPHGLIVRQSSNALAATHPGILRAAAYVHEHLTEPIDMQGLAAVAGVSRRTLFNLFRAEMHCTPAAFLHRERVAKACSLLEESDASVKEVVAACGFGTGQTIHRIFLRLKGLSPSAWRKAHRAKRSRLEEAWKGH